MEGKVGRERRGRVQRPDFGNTDLDGRDGSGTTEDCLNITNGTVSVNERVNDKESNRGVQASTPRVPDHVRVWVLGLWDQTRGRTTSCDSGTGREYR